jgi:hypothetical protein
MTEIQTKNCSYNFEFRFGPHRTHFYYIHTHRNFTNGRPCGALARGRMCNRGRGKTTVERGKPGGNNVQRTKTSPSPFQNV